MELDWHGDRSDLRELALIDQLEADEPIDFVAVRAYRLGRVREQMAARSLDALILLDPVNIRYATGARNMQVFQARNPARYLFVPQSGCSSPSSALRARPLSARGRYFCPPRPSSRHREVAGPRRLPEGRRLRTDSRWQRQEHPAPPEDQAAATAQARRARRRVGKIGQAVCAHAPRGLEHRQLCALGGFAMGGAAARQHLEARRLRGLKGG